MVPKVVLKKEKYITVAGNTAMVRVRGFKQRNFHISDYDKAIAHRNILCSQLGISVQQGATQGCRVRVQKNSSKLSDLPVGISMSVTKRKLADGSLSTYSCIRAGVTIYGKTTIKMFSIEKLGYEKAKRKAISWRKAALLKKATMLGKHDRQRLQSALATF